MSGKGKGKGKRHIRPWEEHEWPGFDKMFGIPEPLGWTDCELVQYHPNGRPYVTCNNPSCSQGNRPMKMNVDDLWKWPLCHACWQPLPLGRAFTYRDGEYNGKPAYAAVALGDDRHRTYNLEDIRRSDNDEPDKGGGKSSLPLTPPS